MGTSRTKCTQRRVKLSALSSSSSSLSSPSSSSSPPPESPQVLPITTTKISTSVRWRCCHPLLLCLLFWSTTLQLLLLPPIQCQRILSQESPGSSQSPPGKLFHETLTPEERLILLGHHSAVPHYEMFSASEELSRALEVVEGRRRVKRSSSRRKRSTAGGGDDHHLNESTAEATFKEDGSSSSPILRLQFTAFSSPFHLRLWPNHKLLSPAFQMINEINGGRQSPFKTKSKGDSSKVMDSLAALEDCFYQGEVEGRPGSAVALSLCNGMQGVIETKEGGVYVVSPLPGHTVERFMQGANGTNSSSSSSSSPFSYHIILRKNGDEFNDYQCPHRQPSKAHSSKKSHSPRSLRFDLVRLSPLNQTTTTTTTTTTTKVAGKRGRRSIDVVASDLNFLDETEGQQQQQQKGQHQQQQQSPQHPTAPIQLDDIGSNDVYDDTSSSSNSSSSSSSLYNSPPLPPSPLSPSTDASNTFNITVETAVFVDESLYHLLSKTFPVDTEQQIVLYVLTIMNAVQLLFKQPSIGRSVEISVVLMDLLKQQPKNLHPSDNIDTYLTNFCVWQHKKRLRESGGPTPDWDHALLLSGINMYVVDSLGRRKRHVVGLAPVSGMCNSLNSCTISEGTSFQTVLVAGHEMGHSLGMEHDGAQDGNACNKDDFVMSPTLGPGKTTWSECSRQYLDKFVLTPQATCVLGRSSHVNIIQQFIPAHQLPGQRFSVDDQCQFRFGPTARHYSGQQRREICRVIKCHVKPGHHHQSHQRKNSGSGYYPAASAGRSLYSPYPPKSTYNTHPALEGTECGDQMWCREGRCVSKSEGILPIIDGGIEEPVVVAVDGLPNGSPQTTENNSPGDDVDNYLISRTKYPATAEERRVSGENADLLKNHHHQHHQHNPNSAPKLNKLKPKPSPYHYKYNSATDARNGFGSRNSNNNNTGTSEPTIEAYLSTSQNKYNPYNDVGGSSSSSSGGGWKPTRDASRKSTTSRPRPSSSSSARPYHHHHPNHHHHPHHHHSGPPVHGNWTAWSAFGPCISECVTSSLFAATSSSSAGGGIPVGVMTALRRCSNPAPINGGAQCSGADTKVKLCNAYQVCSAESAISAATGAGASRLKADAGSLESSLHQRYRMRTVEEYIGDTCSAAAAINDKLEHHGTQYPSYDSASHSCYVWCHKVGGGYMSQGWRLPDGTPCGRKLPSVASAAHSPSSNGTMLSTGHCYNGQCRPFNCAGEMHFRAAAGTHLPSPSASNVYSGRGVGNSSTSTSAAPEEIVEEEVDCPSPEKMLTVPGGGGGGGVEADEAATAGDYDSSYRLVRVRGGGGGPKNTPTTDHHQHHHQLQPPKSPVDWTALHGHHNHQQHHQQQHSLLGPAQQNFFSSLNIAGGNHHHHQQSTFNGAGNWSEWTPVTECQYSTACITTGRGFRLVTRECRRSNACVGRREALQLCEEISQSVHRDPTLYDLYEQYCPRTRRISADAYAGTICAKYRVKYPSLLSGNGRQLLGKNSGCIVACEDRVWKDIHYQMDAFEDGKFPFGTDCSEPNATLSGDSPGYCLNGKCIRFGGGSAGISYDTADSVLYRSEILQLFAPDTLPSAAGVGAGGGPTALSSLPVASSSSSPSVGLASSGSTVNSENSLLYSTISNELYKRATSHQSSPGPAAAAAPFPLPPPNQFNLHQGLPAPAALPTPSALSSAQGPLPLPSSPSSGEDSSLTFATPRRRPSELEGSGSGSRLQLRRIKRSALNFGAARHFRTMKRRRQQPEKQAEQEEENPSSSTSTSDENSPALQPQTQPSGGVIFRKASVQEALDPEADYVSWTLIRSHRRGSPLMPPRASSASVTSYHNHHHYNSNGNGNSPQQQQHPGYSASWTPVLPKKPLRPIKLSHFTLQTAKRVAANKLKNSVEGGITPAAPKQQQQQQQAQPAEHLQTFTLVKHDKSRLVQHIRTWQQQPRTVLLTSNHIALPLGNQTRFLDDDEEEEEDRGNDGGNVNGEEEEGDRTTEAPEEKTVNRSNNQNEDDDEQQPKQQLSPKIRKHFSLGHESWPPASAGGSDSSSDNNNNNFAEEENDQFAAAVHHQKSSSSARRRADQHKQHRQQPRVELRVEPYVWSVILSECSRACGQGIRSVRVVCTVGTKTVDERLCDRGLKPMHKRVEPCKERDCIGRWRSEPWSACSSSKCGGSGQRKAAANAFQSRTIICVGPSRGGGGGGGSPFSSGKRKRHAPAEEEEEMGFGEEDLWNSAPEDAAAAEEEPPTTVDPVAMMTTTPTTSEPAALPRARVFSILSHQYCDQDTKPVQWRSCPAAASSMVTADC